MAIVKMSRFNLIFFHERRGSLLRKLQHFKYVHLEQLKETDLSKQFNLQEVTVEENIKAVDEQIRQTTFIIDQLQPFDFREKGLMQIKDGMPSLDLETLESKAESIQLEDAAIEKLYEIMPKLLKLAEVEKTCQLMADEIEKTRRRVNALEHRTIPDLQDTIYYIEMKLDEHERSTITRLIKVKDLLE